MRIIVLLDQLDTIHQHLLRVVSEISAKRIFSSTSCSGDLEWAMLFDLFQIAVKIRKAATARRTFAMHVSAHVGTKRMRAPLQQAHICQPWLN